MIKLPSFPVDDQTLDLILDALKVSFVFAEDGTLDLVGGEFTLSSLLEFYSGYGETNLVDEGDGNYLYLEPLYTETDIIRSLIDEIKRLRISK